MEEEREQQIDLRDYWHVLVKRRWTVVSCFAMIFVAVAIFSFTATPIYRATARIVIEKENPNVVSIQEVMAVDATSVDYYQTQYKIIESRAVARQVIRRLALADSPEFNDTGAEGLVAGIKAWVRGTVKATKDMVADLFGSKTVGQEDGENDSALVAAFIGRVKVEPIRNSRLVDVSVEAKDPALSAKMANELVQSYINQNLETKLSAAKDAVQWLAERIDVERQKVEEAENALLRYKEKQGIITDFSSDTEKITAEKLAKLNADVVTMETKRVEAETRYQQAAALENSPDMLDSIPEVLANDLVKGIKKMEVELYNRMSELSKKYGRNHPQMVAIDSELAELQKRKRTEVLRVVNSLRNEYKLALAREQSLKQALEQQKKESLEMNQKAVQYGVLQRQAESARNMYEVLAKRFKETTLAEEMKTGNIRMIDPAETPLHPVKPKKKLNLLLAIVVGLAMGVGLAFFLEYLDNTIKLPDQIKRLLEVAYLGPVPSFDSENEGELVVVKAPKSTASEGFRGVRTGIVYSSVDLPSQVMLVTSGGPSEGKTTCAANLAATLSQTGGRVLIIDADLRRPRMHKLFGINREHGLSSVLTGTVELKEAIVPTGVENLDLLPSGPIPPNPAEVVGSRKMHQLLETLKKHYQRVVVDSPPLTAVTDAVVLAKMVDGVVLVIRAGHTPAPVVQNGVAHLKAVNAHVLGAVLNDVSTGRDGYYYYPYYYYYYGESGQKEKKRHSEHRRRKPKQDESAQSS